MKSNIETIWKRGNVICSEWYDIQYKSGKMREMVYPDELPKTAVEFMENAEKYSENGRGYWFTRYTEKKSSAVFRLHTLGEEPIYYSPEEFLYQLKEMLETDGEEYTKSFLEEVEIV